MNTITFRSKCHTSPKEWQPEIGSPLWWSKFTTILQVFAGTVTIPEDEERKLSTPSFPAVPKKHWAGSRFCSYLSNRSPAVASRIEKIEDVCVFMDVPLEDKCHICSSEIKMQLR
jgi:hypothetical protein